MTFGLILMFDASEGQDTKTVYRQTLESIRLAEASGLSSIWLTEHHGKANRLCPSIPLMMSYLAQHTALDIGAATILLSHYPARHIAEEMGMLSNMYSNRFSFGFARGGNGEVELHDGGDERLARNELIAHMDELFGLFEEGSVYPKPSAKTQMFLASKNDEAISHAAKHDMGIMAGHKWSIQEVDEVIRKYTAYHPEGKKPYVLLSRYLLIKDSDDEAVNRVIEDTAKRKAQNNKTSADSKNPLRKEVLEDESPVGTLDKANRLFDLYRDMGVDSLVFRQATFDVNETMASIAKLSLLI